jgi:predicted Fe-Mo cluster-binding NifX family protein
MRERIAIASTDGKVVNQHFGKAEVFYIVEADREKHDEIELKEIRKVQALCEGGEHSEERLCKAIEQIADCQYVLVSRIGYRAQRALEAVGLQVFELPGIITESVNEMQNYLEIQNLIGEL